jgi:hypothetical protein
MNPPSALELEPLFSPVGELVINWSLLDSQFVKITAILYHSEMGKELEKQLPFEFGRRMRFLRKCASRFPELSNHVKDFKRMITYAKEMVVLRNALIHGAVSSFDESDQRYSFVKLDIGKSEDIHVANTVRMTLEDIQAHNSHLTRPRGFCVPNYRSPQQDSCCLGRNRQFLLPSRRKANQTFPTTTEFSPFLLRFLCDPQTSRAHAHARAEMDSPCKGL